MRRSIIYFHSTIWNQFFSDLLRYFQDNENAQVFIICDNLTKDLYDKNIALGAEPVIIPDFDIKETWEDDPDQVEDLIRFIRSCEDACGRSMGRIVLTGERTIGRALSIGFYYWPQNSYQKAYTEDNSKPESYTLRDLCRTC